MRAEDWRVSACLDGWKTFRAALFLLGIVDPGLCQDHAELSTPTASFHHGEENCLEAPHSFMILPANIASLATDPNVAVALISDVHNADFDTRYADSPSLDFTNTPMRLTGFLSTPDYLRNLLDALAAVSASTSREGNETIACALRLDSDHPTRPSVELILSSHEDIRAGTVQYFREIWRQMLAISTLPYKRGPDRELFLQHLAALRHTIYTYTLRRQRGEFMRQMAILDKWTTKHTTDKGHLLPELGSGDDINLRGPLAETLFYLGRCRDALGHMREEEQEPNRLISSTQDFVTFVDALELAKQAADTLLLQHTISLRVLSMRFYGSKHVLANTLEATTSLPRKIVNLLYFAANNMESLHTHTLVLTLVSPLQFSLGESWPRTKKSWTAMREHVLKQIGMCHGSPPKNIKASSSAPVVHGEISLITYLHALHFRNVDSPETRDVSYPYHPIPYNYIGVTSAPCTPSAIWIDAYNARHARRGDGLRFDVAYDPVMRWNGISSGRLRWGWVPLPPLSNNVNPQVNPPRRRSVKILPDEIADRRIIAAAWDAYALAIEAEPDIIDPNTTRKISTPSPLSRSAVGPKKSWPGLHIQTRSWEEM